MPANPEAWLLTVARNRLRDRWKSAAYRTKCPCAETRLSSQLDVDEPTRLPRPQARTDVGLRTPGDRAVDPHAADAAGRARGRCRGDRGGIRRRTRDDGATTGARQEAHPRRGNSLRRARTASDLAERLPAVLEAVYGAYAIDWQVAPDGLPIDSLAAEALHLALRAGGTAARRTRGTGVGGAGVPVGGEAAVAGTDDGRFVPLDEQDTARWDRGLIDRGEQLARPRPRARSPRPLSVRGGHPVGALQPRRRRPRGRRRDAAHVAPRADPRGAVVGCRGRLAALDGEIDGPAAGLAGAGCDGRPRRRTFQPAWAVRGASARALGPGVDAVDAYRRAIELTNDDRRWPNTCSDDCVN